MKPTAIFKGLIADTRKQGQIVDYELAERDTRAVACEQSIEEELASRLVDSFKLVSAISPSISLRLFSALTNKQNSEDPCFFAWPTIEEDCSYARLGAKCDPVCVYCDRKHICMHFALNPSSAEPSVDPPCPLRIPGCRCSTGAGPSIPEYYCNAGDRFIGAYVPGAGNEEFLEAEIEGERFEEDIEEECVIEAETKDNGLVEKRGNEKLFRETEGGEPLDDGNKGEDFVEHETQGLYSPQSRKSSLWSQAFLTHTAFELRDLSRELKPPGTYFMTRI